MHVRIGEETALRESRPCEGANSCTIYTSIDMTNIAVLPGLVYRIAWMLPLWIPSQTGFGEDEFQPRDLVACMGKDGVVL